MLATTLIILNNIRIAEYGDLSVVNNFLLFFFPVLYFGSKSIYLYDFTKLSEFEKFQKYYLEAFSIRITISIIYSSSIILLYIFNFYQLYVLLLLLTLSFEVLDIQNEVCNTKSKNHIILLRSFTSNLFFFIFLFSIKEFDYISLDVIALSYLLRSIINITIGILSTHKYLNIKFNFKLNFNHFKNVFLRSKTLIVSLISGAGFAFFSQLIIKLNFNADELGIYSLSYLMLALMMTLFSIYSTSINNFLIQNFNQSEKINKSIILSLFSSIIFLGLIWGVGDFILKKLLPSIYWDSILIFKLFSFYLVLYSFRPIIEKILLAHGLINEITLRNILFLTISSAISIYLIKIDFGLNSIPISYFISEILILLYFLKRKNTSFIKYLIFAPNK